MKKTQVTFDQNARKKLHQGVSTLSAAVKATLGPKGRNVVIEKEGYSPHITKDGVSVAKAINLEDSIESLGASILKEAAQQTNDSAGDGTTTATVIAESIINSGHVHMISGINPVEIKRGIDKATNEVVKKLKERATEVVSNEEIRNIALVSANSDSSVGNVIADAFEQVGADGVITVMEGSGAETTLDVVEGLEIDRGYLSHFFITDASKQLAELEDCYVLLYDKKIFAFNDVLPILEKVSAVDKPLLIVAENVDGEALATTIVNKARGILKVCAIKAPGFGSNILEYFKDIAAITNATIISEKYGFKLKDVTLEQLGFAKKVIVSKDNTVFVDGAGSTEQINDRINALKTQYDECESLFEKERIQSRLGRLSGGVAVIKVGGQSEVEMKERKDRFDDALHAVKAAHEEGTVPGGGIALARIAREIQQGQMPELPQGEAIGWNILLSSCNSPLRCIVENAGYNSEVVLSKTLEAGEFSYGFDAKNEVYTDMVKEGIIDPVKVTRTALEKAASVAGTLLTTQAVISLVPEKEKEPDFPMM